MTFDQGNVGRREVPQRDFRNTDGGEPGPFQQFCCHFGILLALLLMPGQHLLSKEAAMACTVAVEDVIGDHYNGQIRELMEDDPEKHKELLEITKKFRNDEMHHHDTGSEYDAEKAPFYNALTQIIKIGCRSAISAERI